MEDSDYYGPSEPKEAPEKEREESDVETALLPKSIFGDKKLEAGKKCEFEIVHTYDDEVEVKYVPHKKDGDKDKKEDEDSDDDTPAMLRDE